MEDYYFLFYLKKIQYPYQYISYLLYQKKNLISIICATLIFHFQLRLASPTKQRTLDTHTHTEENHNHRNMSGVGPLSQDWEPVVLRKKAPTAAAKKDEKAVNAARRAGADIDTVKKCSFSTRLPPPKK